MTHRISKPMRDSLGPPARGPSSSARRRSIGAPAGKNANVPVSESVADRGPSTEFVDLPVTIASAVDAAVILDSVVEAIMVFDPDTFLIAEANRGAVELLGRSRDELVGQSIVEVLRGADAEPFAGHVASLAAGDADSTTLTLDYMTGDRSSISVEVVLQPIDLPGGTRVIVAIARDIRGRIATQVRLQRLAELEHSRAAELNAVIRAMGEAVVVCTIGGAITLTNPAAEALFPGLDP